MPPNVIVRVRYYSDEHREDRVAVVRASSYNMMTSIALSWGKRNLEVTEVDILAFCPNEGASPSVLSDGPSPIGRFP